jgi:molybdopterin converting factor subunit 1
MRVTIHLFARLREIATTGELDRQMPDDATTRGVWDALTAEFPKLAEYTTVISCAVNEEYAPFDHHLKDGDEVAFLPPVSGGAWTRDLGRTRARTRDPGPRTRDQGLGLRD